MSGERLLMSVEFFEVPADPTEVPGLLSVIAVLARKREGVAMSGERLLVSAEILETPAALRKDAGLVYFASFALSDGERSLRAAKASSSRWAEVNASASTRAWSFARFAHRASLGACLSKASSTKTAASR